MSYGERKAKREQEIEGLKEALTILSGEALLQASALFWPGFGAVYDMVSAVPL